MTILCQSTPTYAAYVIAAKLRAHAIYATGRDVLGWHPRTIRAVEHWLNTAPRAAGRDHWVASLGALAAPTSPPNWSAATPTHEPRPRPQPPAHGPGRSGPMDVPPVQTLSSGDEDFPSNYTKIRRTPEQPAACPVRAAGVLYPTSPTGKIP
jgi:hypothetical protein